MTNISRRSVLGGSAATTFAAATGLCATGSPTMADAAQTSSANLLAPTPPMGWNSWNSFGTTITEAETKANADVMAKVLKPAGYDILTVDIRWYAISPDENNPYSYNYTKFEMDDYGRLLPAVNRFPSAANNQGFAPLAKYVHNLGLRFGIHRMRGIPRQAVESNTPVLGTKYKAADIADTSSTASWNPDMYGVDMSKPGAQEYYNSVFKQYADWGVDFVKVDDLSRPYDAHIPEIEAIHKAIQNSGRPMILSMSPGATPVVRGNHAAANSQMARISDDFWDDWYGALLPQFTRLENWNEHMGNGFWPDGDMLPLGKLQKTRQSNFTPDEAQTLMTLWSIARSPLIMGGDLISLDSATTALLTNPEVIAVNQEATENQPIFPLEHTPIWTAKAKDGGRYLALFNQFDDPRTLTLNLDAVGICTGRANVRNLWTRQDEGTANGSIQRNIARHACVLLKLTAA